MRVYLLLIICVAFWSGNFVIGRFIRFELDPIQLAFFRWLGVSIIFLPQIIKHRADILFTLKNHFIYIIIVSFFGISCFNTFLYIGLQDTTATNALLINSSIPILIIIFSFFILKIHLSKLQISGVLLSMLGVIYLALNGNLSNLINLTFNKGDIWIILSSISWGLYSTLIKLKPKEVKAFLPTNVFLGTIILSTVFFAKGFHLTDVLHVDTNAQLTILYTVLFASIASYYLWHKAIATIGAGKTGQFTHLMPVFGIILAYIFLDEKLYMYQIFGFILIGIGIWVSLFLSQKRLSSSS